MSLEDCYIQAQLGFLGITLALAGEVPKRSGDFETTYKNESGKEIVVKRSPDGKFANKNSNDVSQESSVAIASVGKSFGNVIGASADEIAKLPAKTQDAVRKAIFDSDFSRVIDNGVEIIIKRAYNPGLEAGFKLGQNIKAELAKQPFSKFAETVTAKIEEFRKDLPQKSEDLKKEIIRIAKDPNTSATVATGVVLGLAAYFHVTGIRDALRAGKIAFTASGLGSFGLLTDAVEKEAVAEALVRSGLKVVGSVTSSVLRQIVGLVLTAQAGRIILDRAKANAQVENDRLKQEILAKKDDSDALYQQRLDQQSKDAETRRKILEELSKGAPKSPADLNPDKPETLAGLPAVSIALTDAEEEFAVDPKRREQILAKAYKDEEFLKLSFAYMEAQALALVAALSDKQSGKEFAEIAERAHAAINDRLTVVIKTEINRLQQLEKQ